MSRTFTYFALALLVILIMPACSKPDLMKAAFLSGAESYFAHQSRDRLELRHLQGSLYVFEHSWNRGVAAKTEKGWVVIDVYGKETARALKTELDGVAPGLPVHLLIYSHYHLDHVEGGRALRPQRILAHTRCGPYWDELSESDVLRPTEEVGGDSSLSVGGLQIEVLDLGRSHTDTLFAIHFPQERVLFGADLAMVNAFPPNGMPDHYRPGFIKALERVTSVDFDTYVSSHFAIGNKADVVANLEFYRRAEMLALEAKATYGFPEDGEEMDAAVDIVYGPLKEEYGHWHGADTFLVPFVMRTLVGVWLGY